MVRGDNAIGVTVAKGWWLSKLPWSREFNYGDKYGLLAQIVLRYKDGTKEVIATDDTWRASTGEVSYGNLYDGETIDLNRRQKGWDTPSFDDASWASVQVADTSLDNLDGQRQPGRAGNRNLQTRQDLHDPVGSRRDRLRPEHIGARARASARPARRHGAHLPLRDS